MRPCPCRAILSGEFNGVGDVWHWFNANPCPCIAAFSNRVFGEDEAGGFEVGGGTVGATQHITGGGGGGSTQRDHKVGEFIAASGHNEGGGGVAASGEGHRATGAVAGGAGGSPRDFGVAGEFRPATSDSISHPSPSGGVAWPSQG